MLYFKGAFLWKIYLVSGGYGFLDSTEILDPSLGGWRFGGTLPRPMSGIKAANIDNRIFFFGTNFIVFQNVRTQRLFAGGWAGIDNVVNSVLEYDFYGDSYTEVGTMMRRRSYHAVSSVKYADFSQWCK